MPLRVFLFISLASVAMKASEVGNISEIHARTGMVNGKFVGPTVESSGSFSVLTTLDVEYEKHTQTQQSYLLRGIIAYDQKTALMDYFYAGIGGRYYFQSQGRPLVDTYANDMIRSIPRWRFYGGWDAGLSQVLVITRGPVFQTYSTLFDVGVNGGAIYQLSDRVGLDFQLGYSFGYGFSSVAVVGNTVRALFGATFFLF